MKPLILANFFFFSILLYGQSDTLKNSNLDFISEVKANPNVIADFLLADGYILVPLSSEYKSGDIMMDNNGGHMIEAIGKYQSGKNKGKMMWRSYWAADRPVVGTLAEITDYNHENNNGHSRAEHNSSNTKLFRPTQGDKVKEQIGNRINYENKKISTKYNYEQL